MLGSVAIKPGLPSSAALLRFLARGRGVAHGGTACATRRARVGAGGLEPWASAEGALRLRRDPQRLGGIVLAMDYSARVRRLFRGRRPAYGELILLSHADGLSRRSKHCFLNWGRLRANFLGIQNPSAQPGSRGSLLLARDNPPPSA